MCLELEKPYLRLTSEPDPYQVRPQEVLKKSLKHLLTKWEQCQVTYEWINDQLKSIRQDLTIQQINDQFTVQVYETHARIAIQNHDIPQFNQCQNRIYQLYKQGIQGKINEFICYRILYFALNNMKYGIIKLLKELTQNELKNKDIQFSMGFQNALYLGNVKQVFNLYKEAPNMCQYLFDVYIGKLRVWALQILTKSFGDKLSIQFLSNFLGFGKEQLCIQFIKETEGQLTHDQQYLMCKESCQNYIEHSFMRSKLD